MKKSIVYKLNTINAKFYQDVALEFHESRQFAWEGFNQLQNIIHPIFQDKTLIKILDLGCGNARFADFINNFYQNKLFYEGVDNNQILLDIAQKKLDSLKINYALQKKDLVTLLLKNGLSHSFKANFYDLVLSFGILHHLPSFKLRKEYLENLANLVAKQGFLVITSWQFVHDSRFDKKITHPKFVKIKPTDLEPHDYILDWQRGIKAYRYCHFTSKNELDNLIEGQIFKDFHQAKYYFADGKSGKLNLYLVLQKK